MRSALDRIDLKESVAIVSLMLDPGYMGPAPAGFVDEIQAIAGAWPHGGTVETALRLRVKNTDLSDADPGRAIHMVRFVSHWKLNTSSASLDWQWIECGHNTQHAQVWSTHSAPRALTPTILLRRT